MKQRAMSRTSVLPLFAAAVVVGVTAAGCATGPGDRLVSSHPVGQRLADAADPVAVVAHRGASADFPENTLVALSAAVENGADVVEFDVYQTRDGAWVLMHDTTLDRTTDARKVFGRSKVRVDEVDFQDLRRLDAGAWFDAKFAGQQVPTLAEALDVLLPDCVPMIERKGGDPDQLVAELRRLGHVDDVLVQAFDWDWLEQAHRAEPRLFLGALGGDELDARRLADVTRTGAALVHWNQQRMTREGAARVAESGRLLCVYTIDDEVAFHGAVALGCELVTTNRPRHFVVEREAGAFDR